MVVSHTLDGKRTPADYMDLFIRKLPPGRKRLTLQKLKATYDRCQREIDRLSKFCTAPFILPQIREPVPFLSQRFLGVR